MVNNFASLSQTLNSQVDNQTTKNCIRCHTPLQIEAKFCLECGQKQDLSCPQCQQKVELGMKFYFKLWTKSTRRIKMLDDLKNKVTEVTGNMKDLGAVSWI